MTTLKLPHIPVRTLSWLSFENTRRLLRDRRGLILLGVFALSLGTALNWKWLVAAGIAPLLLSALPCLAMCALGLCMSKTAGKPNTISPAGTQTEPAVPEASSHRAEASCCSAGDATQPLPSAAELPDVQKG